MTSSDVLTEPVVECLLLAEGMQPLAVAALKRQLVRLHFRVRVAGTLATALRMAHQGRPRLVLAGSECAARLFWHLREHRPQGEEGEPPACLAILREGQGVEEVLRLMMAGADECMVWPFSGPMLARRLRTLPQFA